MILRRITQHVKEQNWFAVALDFFIVVAGLLIAFQITEWKDARSEKQLKRYYLERLQSDLIETADHLSGRQKRVEITLEIIDSFAAALNNPDIEDKELVLKTTDYFERGTDLFDFKVTRATFDDLSATGNLEILGRGSLVAALTQLNTNYADQDLSLLVNTDWVLGFESTLVAKFDWFRFDELTSHLFPSKPEAVIAAEIQAAADQLRRHAAIHYWIIDNVRGGYAKMITDTQSVHDMIDAELDDQ